MATRCPQGERNLAKQVAEQLLPLRVRLRHRRRLLSPALTAATIRRPSTRPSATCRNWDILTRSISRFIHIAINTATERLFERTGALGCQLPTYLRGNEKVGVDLVAAQQRRYALRISLTQPARNHPRNKTTATTKQISAPSIVQSAKGVTPRKADIARNRPPTKARTAAIIGARMSSSAATSNWE